MTADRDELERDLFHILGNPELEIWRLNYEALSESERVCRTVWELEREVNNGGFLQYFFNSSGANAGHAVGALTAIGAIATARLAREAIAILGENTAWADQEARQDHLEDLSDEAEDALDELDQAFYACPDDLTVHLHHYLSTHRADIRGAEGRLAK
jgi:hypothetical protein